MSLDADRHIDANIGARIKQARTAKGWSQTDLAAQASVSQPTVANWENGAHAPRHAMLSSLAALLGTPQSWLLGEAQDAPASPVIHHHVPVLDWPADERDLDRGRVNHYISATSRAARPFALINTQSDLVPRGALVIFDRADQTPQQGGLYLCKDERESMGERGLRLTRLTANEKPPQRILAKAVMVQQTL